MKILLDPQTYNEQFFGGISRYHTEIYLELNKKNGIEIECPILYSNNLHLKEALLFQSFRNSLFESKLAPKFIKKMLLNKYKKANITKSIKLLKEDNFDVFIPTYYSTYFLEHLKSKPFVLTVYDMIHELFPQYFKGDLQTVKNKKLLMERATKIIAISESTKRDIINIYPHIDASKIEIVYLSHSIKTTTNVQISLPKEYILFVGNRTNYKNFIFFINAVAPILKTNPNLFVVCAGGNNFISAEIRLMKELNITSQIIQQNFKDNALSAYYKNAKCFVFPSEYEGFGIPVLEAMACSCPIILANHSSFPEVAGNAGIYFELNNETDLRNKISEIIENKELRDKYVLKGLKQVEKFSWKNTADNCLKVFQKALNNG